MEKLTIASSHQQPETSNDSKEKLLRSKKRELLISRSIQYIFSGYRADQFSDKDGYRDSLKLALSEYPDDIIMHITDPRTGIQRQCKWPPTIAEIVSACEVQMQHVAKLERLRNWGKKEEPARLEAPREERPTLEEMKAKYGEDWGLTPDPRPKPGFKTGQAPSWQEIVSLYTRDPDRLARLVRVANKYAEDRGDAPA